MKQYLKNFFKNEDGMQTLELVIIIALIALALIAFVSYVFNPAIDRVKEAGEAINSITLPGGGSNP